MEIKDFKFIYHRVGDQRAVFQTSDTDQSDPSTRYWGFLSDNGAWIIQRETGDVMSSTSIRYTAGKTDYSTNWTNRATLSYDYFDTLFDE